MSKMNGLYDIWIMSNSVIIFFGKELLFIRVLGSKLDWPGKFVKILL